MEKTLSIVVSLMMVAIAGVFPSVVSAQLAAAPGELLNRSYMSSCGRDKPTSLQIKNGKFGRYLLLADEERKMELAILGTEQIEVSGDKRRHYAVFAKCDVYGKGGYELFILRRSGRRLTQVASAVSAGSGDLYELRYIKQANGLILVGLAYLLPGAKLPPEGSRYEFRFRLNGSKLEPAGNGITDQ